MLDINTLKEVARSVMPYGSNRVAVKPIDVVIKKDDYIVSSGPGGDLFKAYQFDLPKEDGILYYPLVPFYYSAHYYESSPGIAGTLFEDFYFAPSTKKNGIYIPDLPIGDMEFNQKLGQVGFLPALPYGYSILTTAPRFVDAITLKYRPVITGSGPSEGLGVGHYPILKFVVY